MTVPVSDARIYCRDCRLDITGTDDGTGLPYCAECDEAKDDEHYAVVYPCAVCGFAWTCGDPPGADCHT